MTVHWFNYTTLLRESAVLACKRIKGRHTYDVITKMICKVFCEYGITNKVTRVVTDMDQILLKHFGKHNLYLPMSYFKLFRFFIVIIK